MNLTSSSHLIIGAICLSFLVAGCGGSDTSYEGPQRTAVSGTVTFDGQPIPSGTVSFIPQSADQARATGYIANGTYEIKEGQGPNLGSYRVEFSWKEQVGGEDGESEDGESEDEESEDGSDEGAEYVEKLPAKYTTESEITVEFKAGETEHNFTLTP